MKVEVLYFSGCPNHSLAIARVREALEREGASAETVEVEIKDPATALRVHFLGSPSIRINGLDVEPSAHSAQTFGVMCRTYADDEKRVGVPPLEWIRAAVREARRS